MEKFPSLENFYTHAVTDVTDNYQVWQYPMQCNAMHNLGAAKQCTDAMQSWGSRAIQCTIVHRCSFECNAQLQYNLGAAEPVSSLRRHFVTNSLWFTSSLMMMMTMKTMMTNDDDNDDNDDDDK